MPTLPAENIMRAAARWLGLLRASTLGQASSIIHADATYTDLTQTQYASGLEWLRSIELLEDDRHGGLGLSPSIKGLPDRQLNQLLFERTLERSMPAWLPDADFLVPDPGEVPQDAASLAEVLGLSEQASFLAIRNVHGHIDLAERARVGLAGERALIEFLECQWPGSTTHIAEANDGFGYDVLFRHGKENWHLEVKTTTRRGRLVVFLSRHEHEVSRLDPYWRLVVVGLDDQLRLGAVATVRQNELMGRVPRDTCTDTKWQSISHELAASDLQSGLSFVGESFLRDDSIVGLDSSTPGSRPQKGFAWMPGA